MREKAVQRWVTAGNVIRSLKFQVRTCSGLKLQEPYMQAESALAMAMSDEGLSFRHRASVAGQTADFWVSGNRGFSLAVLCTDEGRAGADAMRRRGIMTYELTDRALAEGPRKCARAIVEILNGRE